MFAASQAKRQLDLLLQAHAATALLAGVALLIMPSSVATRLAFDHWSHEFLRLYGCLSLGLAWIVFTTRKLADLLLRKTLAQAFSGAYALQAAVMTRAQVSSPAAHSVLGWVITLCFVGLSGAYAYFVFGPGKLKAFANFESLDKAVD